MPAIASIDSERLRFLKRKASKSVVSLLRYSKITGRYIDFGIGFVLYVSSPKAVILTCVEAFDESEEDVKVRFHDGTTEQAFVFVSNYSSNYISLVVNTTAPIKAVTFNETEVGRGDLIFTLARVVTESENLGIYTGSVIHPKCISVDRSTGKPVDRYDNLFALTCPVAGPCPATQRKQTMSRLIGTPVFNMKAHMVGLVERSSEKSYSIKFATLLSSVTDELNTLFGGSNWKGALESKLDMMSE